MNENLEVSSDPRKFSIPAQWLIVGAKPNTAIGPNAAFIKSDRQSNRPETAAHRLNSGTTSCSGPAGLPQAISIRGKTVR
jgi:hypothetical protein